MTIFTIFLILIYLIIAIALGKLYFLVNKSILKRLNYSESYADPKNAIVIGLLWPVTLPGLLGYAILTGIANLVQKYFYKP